MSNTELKRPWRLTFILVANIGAGSLTIIALFFFTFVGNFYGNSLVGMLLVAIGGALPLFLLVASVMVFLLKPNAPKFLLASVLLFYGTLVLQNTFNVVTGDLDQQQISYLISRIFRTSITIALNFWAVLSEPSRQYFNAAYACARGQELR